MAGSTLKPNIVNPGKNCPVSYTVEDIAEANIFVFEQSFPVAMKGCNYLSGGQDLPTAAARLSAINKANTKGPWNLVSTVVGFIRNCFQIFCGITLIIVCRFLLLQSFSWSQALQLPLLDLCKGKGGLQLDEMSKLYVEELKVAGAAAVGAHQWKDGEGDHKGTPKAAEPVEGKKRKLLSIFG